MYSQSSKSFAIVMIGASIAALIAFWNAPAFAEPGMKAAAGALDDVQQSAPGRATTGAGDPDHKANSGLHPHLFKPVTSTTKSSGEAAAAPETDIWKTAKPAQSPLEQILSQSRGPDYYDHRASDILKQDAHVEDTFQSPLAKDYPDQFVVVCEANCRDREGPQVVSVLPKNAPAPESPSASATDPQAGVITCEGGCTDRDRNYAGVPSPVAETVGEWMTTISQLPKGAKEPMPGSASGVQKATVAKSGNGSGDWMAKIDGARAPTPVAAKLEPVKPEAAKVEAATSEPAKVEPAAPAAAAQFVAPVEAPSTAVAAAPAVTSPATPVAPTPSDVAVKSAEAAIADAPKSAAEAVVPAAAVAAGEAAKPVDQAAASPAASEIPIDKPATTEAAAAAMPVETAPSAVIASDDLAKRIDEATSTKVVKPAPPHTPDKPTLAEAPAVMAPPEVPHAAPSVSPDELKEAAQLAVTSEPSEPVEPAATTEAESAAKPADAGRVAAEDAISTPDEPQVIQPGDEIELTELGKPAAPVAPAASAASEIAPASKSLLISSDDPPMKAAIAKARASLPEFWSKLEKPAANETEFAVKVAIADGDIIEPVWLTRITRADGKLEGTISNVPNTVKNVKAGQRYVFTENRISDWQFKRNGKLVGNETMRTLLPKLPTEQAAAYRSLYETP